MDKATMAQELERFRLETEHEAGAGLVGMSVDAGLFLSDILAVLQFTPDQVQAIFGEGSFSALHSTMLSPVTL